MSWITGFIIGRHLATYMLSFCVKYHSTNALSCGPCKAELLEVGTYIFCLCFLSSTSSPELIAVRLSFLFLPPLYLMPRNPPSQKHFSRFVSWDITSLDYIIQLTFICWERQGPLLYLCPLPFSSIHFLSDPFEPHDLKHHPYADAF